MTADILKSKLTAIVKYMIFGTYYYFLAQLLFYWRFGAFKLPVVTEDISFFLVGAYSIYVLVSIGAFDIIKANYWSICQYLLLLILSQILLLFGGLFHLIVATFSGALPFLILALASRKNQLNTIS